MGKRAASQAQTPARRAKRPRSLDSQLWSCSSSASQIRSRRGDTPKSDRLRPCCSSIVGHTTKAPTWGAKRARTALGRGPPLDGSSSLLHPKWRDWANLGDGPAGLIAERVLANDVADYVRFRAVCRPWRHCCADPRAHASLDARFHPRRWIMLREELASPHRCRFLNASTGECIQIDLPELRDHRMVGRTRECFLLLLHEDTHAIHLLNPLTRVLTNLPLVTTLLPLEQQHSDDDDDDTGCDKVREYFRDCDYGIADDSTSTVVLCFSMLDVLAVAKPGDQSWKKLVIHRDTPRTSLTFGGRFYCVADRGVMVLKPSVTADQLPRWKVVAKLHRPVSEMMDSPHLVDNGGELLMVHRRFRRGVEAGDDLRRGYDVYRVDLENGRLLTVRSFGGRAVFLGWNYSISVPTDAFPSIRGDTIYLSFDFNERFSREKIEAYHLADGSTTPSSYIMSDGSVAQPHSVADCLAWFVTGE